MLTKDKTISLDDENQEIFGMDLNLSSENELAAIYLLYKYHTIVNDYFMAKMSYKLQSLNVTSKIKIFKAVESIFNEEEKTADSSTSYSEEEIFNFFHKKSFLNS